MKRIQILIIGALVLLMVVACINPDLPPIFYTLANEYPTVDDRGLEDEASIFDIVEAESNYFALTSKLIYRTGSGNWDPNMGNRKVEYNYVPYPTDLGSGAACQSIEVMPGTPDTLFAGFSAFGDADNGLYYSTGAADPSSIAWTQVSVTGIDGTQIDWIKLLENGELFVSTRDTAGDYALYYSSDPENLASATYNAVGFAAVPPSEVPYVDVAWNGSVYWVIVGPYLYKGTMGNLTLQDDTVDATAPMATAGRKLRGLLAVYDSGTPTGDVCLTGIAKDQDADDANNDKPSNLWIWDDSASTWRRARELKEPTKSDSDPLTLTQFVDFTAYGLDILIGTVGSGYLELDKANIAAGTITIHRPEPAEIGGLDEGAINSFYMKNITSNLTVVFACTSGAGLWRGDSIWDVDNLVWDWKGWFRE